MSTQTSTRAGSSPGSRLIVGCGPTAVAFVSDDDAARKAIVKTALAEGISVFDTAPIYGSGTSESNLAATLAAMDASPMISSKVFFQDVDGELETSSADGFARASVRESLQRLGRDHLDYLFMHNRLALTTSTPRAQRGPGPEIGIDEFLRPDGIGERLAQLKADGLVDRVGVTGMGSDPQALITALRSGLVDCLTYDVNPATVSAVLASSGPTMIDVAQVAAELGLPLFALRVLGKTTFIGALPSWDEIIERYPGIDGLGQPGARALWEECAAQGLTYSQFATAFTLSLPWVSKAIGGFSILDHLTQALVAAELTAR